jgi:hypothetical protein
MKHSYIRLYTRLTGLVLLTLLVLLSRLPHLDNVTFIMDEAFTVARAMGTPQEVIAWQPFDWPPLYNLMVSGWQHLLTPHPLLLRWFSLLLYITALPVTFHAARRLLQNESGAWLATIIYASLSYAVFLSTFIRAYALALALMPLLLLLTMRYFDRPGWLRGVLLALAMLFAFMTTYTAFFAFLVIGSYTLVAYPRRVWRWWLPGGVALLLVTPHLLAKISTIGERIGGGGIVDLVGLPDSIMQGYTRILLEIGGAAQFFWLALLIVGLVLLLWRLPQTRLSRWQQGWLIAWVFAAPALLMLLVALAVFANFSARYLWWGSLLLALLIAGGALTLPRVGRVAVGAACLLAMFTPFPADLYRYRPPPYEETFEWLREQVRPGDVLVVDPSVCIADCLHGDKWVFYYNFFLGDVLRLMQDVPDVAQARRVWYLAENGRQDPAMQNAVADQRFAGIFYGPWDFLLRLYAGPPDVDGIAFENGLRLHGVDVLDADGRLLTPPYDIREQSHVHLRLWWSLDRPLDADYTVSARIYRGSDPTRIFAQDDRIPQAVPYYDNPYEPNVRPIPLSAWEPGQLYTTERTLSIGPLMTWHQSLLGIVVYRSVDGAQVAAAGVNAYNILPLKPLYVKGW